MPLQWWSILDRFENFTANFKLDPPAAQPEDSNPLNHPDAFYQRKPVDSDSEARRQHWQAKRRQKPAAFKCTDCGSDFTSKHRLESKFPAFLSLILFSFTVFPKLLIPQLAGHKNSLHLRIKDKCCTRCGYKTSHRSDLVRHRRLVHGIARQDTT
jgi:hypothetical protein